MSDESMGEMDSDLKEYLACFKSEFKSNVGKQPKLKATSPAKEKVHKTYENVVEDPSSQKLNSSKENSLSEDSSLFSTSSPHKRFNLQDVNDLQTSYTISENDSTPASSKQDDDNSVSAIGKLVLLLKDLRSTPEDTSHTALDSSNSVIDDVTTSSFNINANVFTVDDLVAAGDIESTGSKSTDEVTENVVFKSSGLDDSEVNSYKDDFEEEEDGENTIVEESFVSESIKESISSSNTTEIQPSKSYGNVELTNATVSSSPDVDEDSAVSQTEETHTFQHSSTSQDTNVSIENSLSKHEVAIQTDPSWKVVNQLGAVNSAFLLGNDLIQRSEAETMALHNLVAQQLHLTRSLIDTARSLHHSQTLAIRPDYQYVTLEDTKKFIKTHKPKVLKMKKK